MRSIALSLLGCAGCGDRDDFGADVDCDPRDASVHPRATETCNGRDDDCDGLIDEGVAELYWTDDDGDGIGTTDGATARACRAAPGFAGTAGDCDDSDPAVGRG